MTSNFHEFAQIIKAEAEKSIKKELSKMPFLELGLRIFMPLTVNIITDRGVASLTILKDANVQLDEHISSNPDVTIQADFETLKSLYQLHDRNNFAQAEKEGKISVTSHNWKGQQAEVKLRELFGS
ncbi:hypothetical protein HXY32_03175 [Candidatus Bathyarchaeota archaeon]|nr:hypothetical protein [Candidatus Bathyarchaeota archaeon]